jgi:D-alanine--poly(phosphoribitol) ligase subunit 2
MNDQIREFIEEQFLIEFGGDFPENTDLFKAGVIDSFGYVRLCRFLERTFDIKISEEEMTSNVLVNAVQIDEYVARKVAGRRPESGKSAAG